MTMVCVFKLLHFCKQLSKVNQNSKCKKMKAIQVFVIIIFISFAMAIDEPWNVDWSQVMMREDEPGFWDNRDIRPNKVLKRFNRGGRIVGGWEVKENEHPYQAGLLHAVGSSTFLCGGSILSASVILTAAHCPEGTDSTQVIVGAHRLMTLERTQQRININRAQYRLHPQYNPRNLNNDIAILLLPYAVEYTQFVQAINIPRADELQRDFVDSNATVR
jgi:hypothetical protein